MKKLIFLLFLACGSATIAPPTEAAFVRTIHRGEPAAPVDVLAFISCGQSNSAGITPREENVTSSANDGNIGVYVWSGNWPLTPSIWDYSTQGFPTSFATPQQAWTDYDTYTNQGGPDLAFSRTVDAASSRPVYMIKYAVNGTALRRSWRKSITVGDGFGKPILYQSFIDHCNNALASLQAYGRRIHLSGIIWCQGHGDTADSANDYGNNLLGFMAEVRADLNHPDADTVPWVITGNPDFWTAAYKDDVQAGKEYAVANDPVGRSVLVSAAGLTARDVDTHFDTDSYEVLGYRCGEAWLSNF